MQKCKSCSWQHEHHTISRYKGLHTLKEIAHVSHEIFHFKNHGFPYILYCRGQGRQNV